MGLEQNLNKNSEEGIKTNEVVVETVPVIVPSTEEKEAKVEEKKQKEEKNNKEIEEKRKEILQKFEEQETKNEFPEGHVMNPKMLEKIAQLEAIDPDTLEFNQQRYDAYLSSSEGNTIKTSQDDYNKRINEGKKPRNDNVTIYGKGGYNRYSATEKFIVKLDTGHTVSSGKPEYRQKLAEKAKEFGLEVNE